MRMKEIRSLRELSRTLNVDQRIRRLCLIEDGERGYPRSVLSRFTNLVGAERLRRIIDEKVVMLLRRSAFATYLRIQLEVLTFIPNSSRDS